MVLSRQTLFQLMRLTGDSSDVRPELLNRLLSGEKLTGRDAEEIRRLWREKMDAMEASATRQRESFVGEDKSE